MEEQVKGKGDLPSVASRVRERASRVPGLAAGHLYSENMHPPCNGSTIVRRTHFVSRVGTGAAVVAMLLICVVACSSGTNSSTTSASSPKGTATSAAVAKEKAFLAHYQKAPTLIGHSTSFPKTPPKGKTFVSIQCDIPQCQLNAEGAQAAAAALGWKFKSVPFQLANPASLVAAMKTALQYHPIAVTFSGLPEAVWQSELGRFKEIRKKYLLYDERQ